jgi:inhibitor of cysteine peptidase
MEDSSAAFGSIGSSAPGIAMEAPERVSETNIQVGGIDEPDILKTDGINIYFSNNLSRPMPFREPNISIEEDYIAPEPANDTKVIKAFPPAEIQTLASINESGEMLLFGTTLVNFSGKRLTGYDVGNPSNPVKKWEKELDENTQIETARKFDNKLYLVSKRVLYGNKVVCPIPLIKDDISISCTDVYYPTIGGSSNMIFTVLVIDPQNGSVQERATFLGDSYSSVTYMSENYVYISFTYHKSMTGIILNFFTTEGKGVLPDEMLNDIERVAGYDISEDAKLMEVGKIMEVYISSMTEEENKVIEKLIEEKMENYMSQHSRDFEKTGIARFDAKTLEISSSEAIPGRPLNQFSLDEYRGNLRIATTVSNFFSDSFNDVYVLNENLNIIGIITDLGITERIYSARFVGDKGYLVTFRQIDPFYVLDLSNPEDPKMTGELKIPGYSSYLHPLEENIILGVGMEDSNAKVSLFDVSDPFTPKEVSKYTLPEYWSEVNSNHRAFLQDDKHSVFFMPAGQNGYVFSYKGNVLEVKKEISGIYAKRALYLQDYLYVVGDAKMNVFNELNWEEVATYDFRQ